MIKSFFDKFSGDNVDLDKEVIIGLVCGCSIMFGTTVSALISYIIGTSDGVQEFNYVSMVLLIACAVMSLVGMILSLRIVLAQMEFKNKRTTVNVKNSLKRYYDAHPEEKEWAIKNGRWSDEL